MPDLLTVTATNSQVLFTTAGGVQSFPQDGSYKATDGTGIVVIEHINTGQKWAEYVFSQFDWYCDTSHVVNINTLLNKLNTNYFPAPTGGGGAPDYTTLLTDIDTNTGNTVTALATTNSTLSTVATNTSNTKTSVDTVNTTLGTTNSTLSTVATNTSNTKTSVDTVNTTLGTTNSTLSTVATNTGNTKTSVDTVNTTLGTTNTNLTTINTTTAGVTTAVNNLSSAVAPTGNSTITTTIVTAGGSGTVTAGSYSAMFTFTGFTGTINGQSVPATNGVLVFEHPRGQQNPAIAYAVTTGTLRIDKIT